MRARLQSLADRIAARIGPFGYRVFVDSAPVLERALARNAGLGWIGKNTCLINKDAGSWFFLGEIFVDAACPSTFRPAPIAVPAPAASTSARPGPSSRRIASMPGAASVT